MFELVLASLLFHAAACTVLLLLASGSAAKDLHHRRANGETVVNSLKSRNVMEMPASPRVSKSGARVEPEVQSKAA
jgi:hypothetical protein